MEAGYIEARVYTSSSEIPVEGATFTVFTKDEDEVKLLGVRRTDANGRTGVIPVEAPDSSLSTVPGNAKPYRVVNLRIDHPYFRTYYLKGARIFAKEISLQTAELVPTTIGIPFDSKTDTYDMEGSDIL